MKSILRLAVLALGLASLSLTAGAADYPPVSFVIPGGVSVSPEKTPPLQVIVEADGLLLENHPIPNAELVASINSALKAQGAVTIAVHIRQGIKFGDVVRAIDELRKTDAKAIGVSTVELAPGQTL